MHCDRCRALLTALTDGELCPATAWRVRRHLARCPDCATLYADINRVQDAARAFRATTDTALLPTGLGERIVSALPISIPMLSEEKNNMSQPISSLVPGFWPAIWRPALITAAVATGIAALTFGPGGGRTAVAKPTFAVVRSAVQQLHTVHILYWMKVTGTESDPDNSQFAVSGAHVAVKATPDTADAIADATATEAETIVAGKTPLIDGWADLDRPALSMRIFPGMRLLSDGHGSTLYGMDGAPMFLHDKPVTREALQRSLLSPESLIEKSKGEESVPGAPTPQWGVGEETLLDGKPALRFTANGPNGVERTFWADPQNHLPLRYEMHVDPSKVATGKSDEDETGETSIAATFEYGQTPPESVFTAPTRK